VRWCRKRAHYLEQRKVKIFKKLSPASPISRNADIPQCLQAGIPHSPIPQCRQADIPLSRTPLSLCLASGSIVHLARSCEALAASWHSGNAGYRLAASWHSGNAGYRMAAMPQPRNACREQCHMGAMPQPRNATRPQCHQVAMPPGRNAACTIPGWCQHGAGWCRVIGNADNRR
jgi:hypothetical protein